MWMHTILHVVKSWCSKVVHVEDNRSLRMLLEWVRVNYRTLTNMRTVLRSSNGWMILLVFYSICLTRGVLMFCAYDPCSFADCDGKTCVALDCSYSCVCDAPSTSADCLNVTSSPIPFSNSTSDPNPIDSNTTSDVVTGTTTDAIVTTAYPCPCVHGYCRVKQNGQFGSCVCDERWSGTFCNLSCNLPCSEGEVCYRIPDTVMQACRLVDTTTSVPFQNSTDPVTTENPASVSPGQRSYNVCDVTYRLRPDDETTCNGTNFQCIYGVCVREDNAFHCECDVGAIENRCTTKCCRYCGEHGDCDVLYETKEQVCNCHLNYTGEVCEIYDPPRGTVFYNI